MAGRVGVNAPTLARMPGLTYGRARMLRWLPLVVTLAVGSVVGCKPEIGDSCRLSTDCSTTGDRLCDTSMPGGYCTLFNCTQGSCPSESVCVEFHPGADRFARRFCVRGCESPSDCREGYVCVAPKERDGEIVRDTAFSTVCLP